jgi:uncharacterized protein with FMN-binding domain
MKRSHLVLAGTVVGTAAVLAFPVQGHHLVIPASSSPTTTASSADSTTTTQAVPGATTPTSAAATTVARSATGADASYPYGDLAVTVTVTGTKITNVTIATLNSTDGHSASIDDYAVPQLEQQVISAGSANIAGVSGATFTSQAFVDSVASALSKLGIS